MILLGNTHTRITTIGENVLYHNYNISTYNARPKKKPLVQGWYKYTIEESQ